MTVDLNRISSLLSFSLSPPLTVLFVCQTMDSSPKSYPFVNFVLSRIASLSSRSTSQYSEVDIEQPQVRSESDDVQFVDPLVEKMPHLKDPKVIAEMTAAISEIAKTRSVLEALGDRPDHETIDKAKKKVSELQSALDDKLEENWGSLGVPYEEIQRMNAIEKERDMYKAVVQLDELHREYEKLLTNAEKRLTKIYDSAAAAAAAEGEGSAMDEGPSEEMSEDIARILEQHAAGRGIENVDLSGTRLKHLPEAFGGIRGLVLLNLSNNHLQVLPETIAGLEGLEELNLSSNVLDYLPDSIGFLVNLKTLNVSHNKITSLPDTISRCRCLVDLDTSFNNLTYLPTDLGYEMLNLRRLSLQYNKLRSLPTSVGEMKSLQQLYIHFNELRDLPLTISKLTNLEIINLSGNFADLTELPESFGGLINLKELDLSNNQIQYLPDNFGRLENLTKLNLDQNPIEIPPSEIVCLGVEAVVKFMAHRWLNLQEEEEKNVQELKEDTETGWIKRSLSRSTSWLKQQVSSQGSPREMWLNQQL